MANSIYDEAAKMAQGTLARGGLCYQPAIAERLALQRREHEAQIEKIDRTLELLSKNPDIEELLNLTRSLL